MKTGRTGPPIEPCYRPQAGKSWDPRSQNTDSSPRVQGAPGLGPAGRRKGKSEAPRALTACGLGRRVAVDWAWAALFPHAPLILCHARRTRSRTQPLPFLLLERPLSFLLSNSSFRFQANLEPFLPLPLPWLRRSKGRGKTPMPPPRSPSAAASLAATLLAGSFSTVLTLLLIPPLILSFLLLSK